MDFISIMGDLALIAFSIFAFVSALDRDTRRRRHHSDSAGSPGDTGVSFYDGAGSSHGSHGGGDCSHGGNSGGGDCGGHH